MRVVRLGQSSSQAADKFESALNRLTNLIETRVVAAFKSLSEKAEVLGGGFASDAASNFLGHFAASKAARYGQIRDFIYQEATYHPWWHLRYAESIGPALRVAGFSGYENLFDEQLLKLRERLGTDGLRNAGIAKADLVSAHHSLIAGGRPTKRVVLGSIELTRRDRLEAVEKLARFQQTLQTPVFSAEEIEEMRAAINEHVDRLKAAVEYQYSPVGRVIGAMGALGSRLGLGFLGAAGGPLAIAGAAFVGAMHGQALQDARTRELLATGDRRIMGIAQLAGASPLEFAKGITAAEQSMSGSLASILMVQRIGPWIGNMYDSRNAGEYAIQAAKAIMGDDTIPREMKRRAMAEIGMTEAMAQIEALGLERWESMVEKSAAGSSTISRFGIFYNYAKTSVLDWLAGIGNKLLGGSDGAPEAVRENTAAIRRLTDVMMTGQRQAFGSGRHPYEPVPTQWLLYSANMATLMTQASRLSSI